LAKLRQHPQLYHLKHIYCKIRPANSHHQLPEAAQPPMPRISLETAQIILDSTNTIKHDKLRIIMQNIAKNTTKKDPYK